MMTYINESKEKDVKKSLKIHKVNKKANFDKKLTFE